MTLEDLDRRIRQMHASLDETASEDLSSVRVRPVAEGKPWPGGPEGWVIIADLDGDMDDAQLLNVAEKLVENIARLRDHLKVWCIQSALPFDGDAVINNNRSVALVHDLWNTQKHAELSRPTRSGIKKPQLVRVAKAMRVTQGPTESTHFRLPLDGSPMFRVSGPGRGELILDGEIQDENGNRVAGFLETCEEAVGHWEAALARAGVVVPPRG